MFREIAAAIDQLVEEVGQGDLSDFWSEHDIHARHWQCLRERLRRHSVEVHLELTQNGRRADVSVVPKGDNGWSDRSRVPSVYAAEFKSFPDWRGGQYREDQANFAELLRGIEVQFNRLRDHIASGSGTLRGGLVLWRDIFPWNRPLAAAQIEAAIDERVEWVQRFNQPGSRVRFEYLRPSPSANNPRLSFDNGFSELVESEYKAQQSDAMVTFALGLGVGIAGGSLVASVLRKTKPCVVIRKIDRRDHAVPPGDC